MNAKQLEIETARERRRRWTKRYYCSGTSLRIRVRSCCLLLLVVVGYVRVYFCFGRLWRINVAERTLLCNVCQESSCRTGEKILRVSREIVNSVSS